MKYTPFGNPLDQLTPEGWKEYEQLDWEGKRDFRRTLRGIKVRDYFRAVRRDLPSVFYQIAWILAGNTTDQARADRQEAERPNLEKWLATPVDGQRIATVNDAIGTITEAQHAPA